MATILDRPPKFHSVSIVKSLKLYFYLTRIKGENLNNYAEIPCREILKKLLRGHYSLESKLRRNANTQRGVGDYVFECHLGEISSVPR